MKVSKKDIYSSTRYLNLRRLYSGENYQLYFVARLPSGAGRCSFQELDRCILYTKRKHSNKEECMHLNGSCIETVILCLNGLKLDRTVHRAVHMRIIYHLTLLQGLSYFLKGNNIVAMPCTVHVYIHTKVIYAEK